MLVENSDGSLDFIPDHLAELLAEAEENERRGTFWYTCPDCNFTTNVIHDVYEHKLDNCQNKPGCQLCGYPIYTDIEHYVWHGYDCLQDGVQTMRAKLRPRRSTPYKPPQRRFGQEEKGKGKKRRSRKESPGAGASSSGRSKK